MDDKKLDEILAKIDKSLDGMDKSLREIVDYTTQLRKQAERDLEEKIEHLRQLTTRQPLMSGRWHRRDGDGFPTVDKQAMTVSDKLAKEIQDANSPSGDIRPLRVGGD